MELFKKQNNMKQEMKNKLDEDKSMEFMLEYLQDECKVDLDCVINFLLKELPIIKITKTK